VLQKIYRTGTFRGQSITPLSVLGEELVAPLGVILGMELGPALGAELGTKLN
jgi:hypothetical protein